MENEKSLEERKAAMLDVFTKLKERGQGVKIKDEHELWNLFRDNEDLAMSLDDRQSWYSDAMLVVDEDNILLRESQQLGVDDDDVRYSYKLIDKDEAKSKLEEAHAFFEQEQEKLRTKDAKIQDVLKQLE